MKNFKNTREVVTYLSQFISGNTIDFGAGTAKYKTIIEPKTSSYTTFDVIPGDAIDITGDALNPPFEDGTFDTVISTQVLEHVEKPWVVVNQMNRILNTGGTCIVSAPFLVPYHADPYDFFRYTQHGLESLFLNEGFSIVESGTYGNTTTVLAEMIHFAHLSPYKKTTKSKHLWRERFLRILQLCAVSLDRVFQNDAVYANVYVVAKKK